jgi:V/A-type H+-transporting ATPase subunit K
MSVGLSLAVLAASISIVFGGLGTIFGTLYAAKGGAGLVAEKPQTFGSVLLTSALPSSQGIYGFLGAVLILQRTELLSGTMLDISTATGFGFLAAAFPIAVLCLFSGWGQGKVLQSGLAIVSKNPAEVGKSVILGVLMESMAVFGLLLSILIINNITI